MKCLGCRIVGSRFKVVGLALRDLVVLVSLIRTFPSEKVSSSSTVGTVGSLVIG